MCGIAGRFDPFSLATDVEWHARACALLAHRGPDGHGSFRDERCELVHRRLAIVDLSPTGHQPMPNEDGSIQVVFNGEIYNHRELRAALKRRGHCFRGTSDTEVLVHLYEEDGVHMASKLRGIFAYAVYDQRRASLMLARDRFGVKPLYYAVRGHELVFASEIKAILAYRGISPEVDRQACYDFLGLGYIPEPASGFVGISALPKATTLMAGVDGLRFGQFHTVTAVPQLQRGILQAATAAEERLLDAVRGQSVADVPVAALLSGGIDSSLVVAAHSRSSSEPPTTFNVRFPAREYDETAIALGVAEHCQTRHHTIDLEDYALSSDALLALLRHFDQPFADMSLVPMYWVSRAVRDHGFICTLSGDGGDEVFGGYSSFWRANTLAKLMRAPGWVRGITHVASGLATGLTRDWGRQVAKATRLAGAGQRDSAMLLSGLSSYLSEEQKQGLVRPDAREGLLTAYRHFDGYQPDGVADLEELSRRMTECLFAVSLPADMLRKVDMMSMRASIEVRVPMLDENVVALGLSLPHQYKTDGKVGKRVLRTLASRWLPRQVAVHPKHGFSIPMDVMVPGDVHRLLEALLLAPDARTRVFLDAPVVERWLSSFQRARAGEHGGSISRGGLLQRVFMVLALEAWMREHSLSW